MFKNITKKQFQNAFQMAWPAVIESFFTALAGIIDSYMVSGLGSNAVASVGLTTQPKFIALAVFFGFNVATSALVARRRGEGNKEDANRVLSTAVVWVAILSLLISALFVIFANPIISFCGSQPETHDGAVIYLRIIIGGQIFTTITNVINSSQRGSGNTKITMRTNLTASAVNICFNYLLIEGHFGFPRLELLGAALATVMGYMVACCMSIISLYKKDNFVSLPYIFKNKIHPASAALKSIFNVGSSVFVENLLLRVGFFATAYMAARMGTPSLAAHNIGMNMMGLSFSFGDGLQAASVALIGRALGEKNPELAKTYGKVCRLFGLAVGIVMVLFFFLLGRTVFSAFFVEEEIIEYGVGISYVLGCTTAFQIQSVILNGALKGAGDTRYTAKIAVFTTTVIRTVVSFVAGFLFHLGVVGVWFGVFGDMFTRFLFFSAHFKKGDWVHIKI